MRFSIFLLVPFCFIAYALSMIGPSTRLIPRKKERGCCGIFFNSDQPAQTQSIDPDTDAKIKNMYATFKTWQAHPSQSLKLDVLSIQTQLLTKQQQLLQAKQPELAAIIGAAIDQTNVQKNSKNYFTIFS